MKKSIILICTLAIGSFAVPVDAQNPPKEVKRVLNNHQLQGKTTTRFWGFKLYDAQLWTQKGGPFDPNEKFALSLRYAHPFTAEELARSTVEEIGRVEGRAPEAFGKLEAKLLGCLIDVDKGDRVTGVAEAANRLTMFVNGRKSCSLSYPQLRERFFGIWLAPTSRDAKGAARLVGKS